MTKQEIVNLIQEMVPTLVKTTLNDYFNQLEKAPESEWSKTEGGFSKATKDGITDGTAPCMYITREQGVAMINRLDKVSGVGLLNKKED